MSNTARNQLLKQAMEMIALAMKEEAGANEVLAKQDAALFKRVSDYVRNDVMLRLPDLMAHMGLELTRANYTRMGRILRAQGWESVSKWSPDTRRVYRAWERKGEDEPVL